MRPFQLKRSKGVNRQEKRSTGVRAHLTLADRKLPWAARFVVLFHPLRLEHGVLDQSFSF